MKFGEHLKQARLNKNLTQEQVAQEFAITRQTLSNWENEKSYPDINSLIKLSDYYQLSLDELLKEDTGMRETLQKREVVNNLKQVKKKLIIAVIGMLIIGLSATILEDNASNVELAELILFWISYLMLCSALMDINNFDESQSLGLEYGWQEFLISIKGAIIFAIVSALLSVSFFYVGQVKSGIASAGLGAGFLVGIWISRHRKH
ncbi:helix-turn-helix domain-containing protein [Lactobacillus sp. ESL0703]|uniref:helix-turn-helix domain-containing protein n=1 Tax=Lactobacillus sp. ESL0703 TaxID=2983218 RepID=UPI0023F88E8D|nr:helix-turn-helix domain-containing protein [Lactobacillus sp. ESL0703]MDF7669001.1 helix-turn-helix domain-containing protein [Lactobacillus sp. ESL0703]